ncbi:MAG: M14 family zinc carboxypeptidase [Candidatus Sericytochromatia bacterium]|nr:M14 family zinc carboxypeptidase [Candidatus Sericytochromatia bacterium]
MRQPLLSLLAATLLLAACGRPAIAPVASETATGQAASRSREASVGRISFKHDSGLAKLERWGFDLFENVDRNAGTVGARLTEAQIRRLKAAGFGWRAEPQMKASLAFPAGYRRIDQLRDDVRALAKQHPDRLRVQSIGQSLEGREILALELLGKTRGPRPPVLFYSGVHARELVPVEIQLRLLDHLVTRYGKDPVVTRLLDEREVWIIPMLNPDGRQRVEQGEDFWRKNARLNPDGSFGVDLNRNCDNHWQEGEARPNEEVYRGQAPLSEPETRVLTKFMSEKKFTLAVDMHSFGGMLLWPPGYGKTFTKQEAVLGKLGRAIANRLAYKTGTIGRVLYHVTGDTTTWVLEAHGTLAFTIELNDPGFSPAFAQVEKDWNEWRWPLIWLALAAGNPDAAEMTLPPEPPASAGVPGLALRF